MIVVLFLLAMIPALGIGRAVALDRARRDGLSGARPGPAQRRGVAVGLGVLAGTCGIAAWSVAGNAGNALALTGFLTVLGAVVTVPAILVLVTRRYDAARAIYLEGQP